MDAKRAQKYRKRIQESRENHGEFKKPKMTNAERQRIYRQRLKDKEINTEVELDEEERPTSQVYQPIEFSKTWQLATKHIHKTFFNNEFGHACDVCDRLWFQMDVKIVAVKVMPLQHHGDQN